MREDFLHYIWKFKKFDFGRAKTIDGLPVIIYQGGIHNYNSGPDFFNAKLKIGEQTWAGNVEIHLKSSDWYAHRHEQDPGYDNVILHVVWEDDVEIFRKDNTSIPTLELNGLVNEDTMQNYRDLLLAPNAKWINCENDFPAFDDFELSNWLERLYLEKLEGKSMIIRGLLEATGNNWEAVLFQLLCKNFGLRVNGSAFLSMAQSIDFKTIQKNSSSAITLEALFFGQSRLLDGNMEDAYFKNLQEEYRFLVRKYKLNNKTVERPKYFRLRPDNFPNIRLSQLAALYSTVQHLFAEIINAKTKDQLFKILQVGTSNYWKFHYTFEKEHAVRNKRITESFLDLLIINTVVPLQFYYQQTTGTGDPSRIITLISGIKTEENAVIKKFNSLRPGTAVSALQSQGLLHLKKEYCDKNGCLKCNMGTRLIMGSCKK